MLGHHMDIEDYHTHQDHLRTHHRAHQDHLRTHHRAHQDHLRTHHRAHQDHLRTYQQNLQTQQTLRQARRYISKDEGKISRATLNFIKAVEREIEEENRKLRRELEY